MVTVPQYLTRKMKDALEYNVPMVNEDFLHDSIEAGHVMNARKYKFKVHGLDDDDEPTYRRSKKKQKRERAYTSE